MTKKCMKILYEVPCVEHIFKFTTQDVVSSMESQTWQKVSCNIENVGFAIKCVLYCVTYE